MQSVCCVTPAEFAAARAAPCPAALQAEVRARVEKALAGLAGLAQQAKPAREGAPAGRGGRGPARPGAREGRPGAPPPGRGTAAGAARWGHRALPGAGAGAGGAGGAGAAPAPPTVLHGARDPLLGCLNKLSAGNFRVVVPRVRAMVESGAVRADDCVRALLQKSGQDRGYAALYVRALQEACGALPGVAAALAEQVAGMHAQLAAEAAAALALGREADARGGAAASQGSAEYDLFCRATLARKLLMGKCRTLSLLVCAPPPVGSVAAADAHAGWLLDGARAAAAPGAPPDALDVWLDMTDDALACAVPAPPGLREALAGAASAAAGAPARTRFKAMDILQRMRAPKAARRRGGQQ